jgi:sugar/nucleoside kinase (ribokinase family)
MKLLLIGHSAEDHIYHNNNYQLKPGGLYYTASAMLNIKSNNDEVWLITSIDKNSYSRFSSVYDKLNTSLSVVQHESVPAVRLDIYDDKERTEKYLRLGERLNIPYDTLDSFDGIFINMISGFDISIDQLKEIRRRFKKTIYMDVHTLSRGVGKNLERPQTIIKDFDQWAGCLDIIQANQTEVFSLYDFDNEQEIAKRVLDAGTKYLVVTKESRGAAVYYKHDKDILSSSVPAKNIIVRNKVGCGDIFGAVFFYYFIKFGDVIKSLNIANEAAGLVSSYENFDDISKLRNDLFSRHN